MVRTFIPRDRRIKHFKINSHSLRQYNIFYSVLDTYFAVFLVEVDTTMAPAAKNSTRLCVFSFLSQTLNSISKYY